jgi:hypothetical protein
LVGCLVGCLVGSLVGKGVGACREWGLSPPTAGLHPNGCAFGHVAAFRMQPAVRLHSAYFRGIRSTGLEPPPHPTPGRGFRATSRPCARKNRAPEQGRKKTLELRGHLSIIQFARSLCALCRPPPTSTPPPPLFNRSSLNPLCCYSAYGWIGQQPSSGFFDRPREPLGVFASSNRF